MRILNVTPHALNFHYDNGTEFVVEPSGIIINATAVEEVWGVHASGAKLVHVTFEPSEEAEGLLDKLERDNPGVPIVGSMFAAQAFPGRVLAMVAAKGYERRPPVEKRMDPMKFTTF